jgi:metal-dependent hydrolase (beta-lactamase superfamily II)
MGNLSFYQKKDSGGIENLYLPDLILSDDDENLVLLIEGKKFSTLSAGLEEIRHYGSIEREYISRHYPNAEVERWLSIFGGNKTTIPHEQVLIYLANNGQVFINANAPQCIKRAFDKLLN